jgi:serine/threonine protein kinase
MSVPDLIGRYRLGPRLGSGGFAVVWLAHDESLDTEIAIKVMSEHWADRLDLRERFLTEARMLRKAASNRIVQVFDIGELPDGRPYFVMDFADRGTLADRAKAGPLPLVEALRLSAEVARGAAELHRVGIVHRDLKPSNVLISSTPHGHERLLIADLGVAKSLAQASGLTMSVGSAGYMAPEQSGPNSGVDVTADIYSLGAIAYRLITGEVPGLPGYVQMDPARLDRPDVPELPVDAGRTRPRWRTSSTSWPTCTAPPQLAAGFPVVARSWRSPWRPRSPLPSGSA